MSAPARPDSAARRLAIMRHPKIGFVAKLVAIRILDLQGLQLGACTKSAVGLGAELGLAERTVRKALAELSAEGLLVTQRGKWGVTRPRKLNLAALDSAEPMHSRARVGSEPTHAQVDTCTDVHVHNGAGDPCTGVHGTHAQACTRRAPRRAPRESTKGEGAPRARPATPSAPPPSDPTDRIKELEGHYPSELVTAARHGCALSRRSGKMADSVWLRALEQMAKHPPAIVAEGLRVFVEQHADGDKGERYLLGIIRGESKRAADGTGRNVKRPGRTFDRLPPSLAFGAVNFDADEILTGPDVSRAATDSRWKR